MLLVNFIGTLGFTIVVPFLVFLVTRFGGNSVLYGLVAAAYPVFQFIGAPVLGRWSDRYGRKKILLVSQAGTLLSWLIFSLALFLPLIEIAAVDSELLGQFTITLPIVVIVIARALDGLTGGNISVANAYVADISSQEDRTANFGKMGVAANLGMILGPALASVLGSTPLKEALPIFGSALISLIATVLIAVRLPESNPRVARRDCARKDAGQSLGQEARCALYVGQESEEPEPSVQEVLRQPNMFFVLGLYFLILLAFNFFYTAFPIHAATELNWSVTELGIFFAVLSAILVVVEGPLLTRLSKRFSESTLIITGLIILGTNFVLLTSTNPVLVFTAAGLFAVGNGIMWPPIVAVVSKVAEARLQGAVQGLAGSAGSLASVVGLIAGGIAYATLGAATFFISAGLAYLAFVLACRLPSILARTASTGDESPQIS